jgi:DNA polymerase III delta prime subunit
VWCVTVPAKDNLIVFRRVIKADADGTVVQASRPIVVGNSINKIIPALQSRCTRFRFGPLETDQVQTRLEYVIKQEKYDHTRHRMQVTRRMDGDGAGPHSMLLHPRVVVSFLSVHITPDGLRSIMKLAGGDMRKVTRNAGLTCALVAATLACDS